MNLMNSIKAATQGKVTRLKPSPEPTPREARDRLDSEIPRLRDRLDSEIPRLRDLAERSRDPAVSERARMLQRRAERAVRSYGYAMGAILEAQAAGQAAAKAAQVELRSALEAITEAERAEAAAQAEVRRVTGHASTVEADMASLQQTVQRDHAEAADAFAKAVEDNDTDAIEQANRKLADVEQRATLARQQMQAKQRMLDALREGPIARAQAVLDAATEAVSQAQRRKGRASVAAAEIAFDLQVGQLLIEAAKCQAAHAAAGMQWTRLADLSVWAFHGEHVLGPFGAAPMHLQSGIVDDCSLAITQPTAAEVLAMIEAEDLEAAYAALPQPAQPPAAPGSPTGEAGVFTFASQRQHPFTVNGV